MSSDHEIIRQLYIEKLAGLCSPADEVCLHELLSKDSDNQFFYQSLVDQGVELGATDFVKRNKIDGELAKLNGRINSNRRYHYWVSSVAAVLVFGLAVLWFSNRRELVDQPALELVKNVDHVQLLTSNGEKIDLISKDRRTINIGETSFDIAGNTIQTIEGGETAKHTLVVPAKLDYHITLSDGTKIYLNSLSELRFPAAFAKDKREIFLVGEAYLEVAKDVKRPFVVHTHKGKVRVLGTQFNLNTYENGMSTSLVEGSVQLSAGNSGKSVVLTPGIQANYTQAGGFDTRKFDQNKVLSWRKGIHYFKSEKLENLVPIVSRWFDMDVEIATDRFENITFSGLIEKGELQDFLKNLTISSDIQYEIVGKRIIFR